MLPQVKDGPDKFISMLKGIVSSVTTHPPLPPIYYKINHKSHILQILQTKNDNSHAQLSTLAGNKG